MGVDDIFLMNNETYRHNWEKTAEPIESLHPIHSFCCIHVYSIVTHFHTLFHFFHVLLTIVHILLITFPYSISHFRVLLQFTFSCTTYNCPYTTYYLSILNLTFPCTTYYFFIYYLLLRDNVYVYSILPF